jgi:hypothetical protein
MGMVEVDLKSQIHERMECFVLVESLFSKSEITMEKSPDARAIHRDNNGGERAAKQD